MKLRLLLTSALLYLLQSSIAQQKQDVLDYIAKYKDIALAEMVRSKIPASITLAQGIHESNCGKSPLSSKANNHFGIKCKREWDGKKFYQNDDAPNECFRVYERAEDSYADHSDFLTCYPRYSFLFDLPITDYTDWAYGLKQAGYATNPRYPQILLCTIEDYKLDAYDQIGLAMMGDKTKQLQPALLATIPPKHEKTNAVASANYIRKEELKPTTANAVAPVPSAKQAERPEYTVNGLKAARAQGSEDPLSIAFEYGIDYAQVLAYNDLADGEHFKDGENIFLQPKKQRTTDTKYSVQAGESMRSISQKFGIRLKELYSKNQMKPNDQLAPGETAYLNERRNDLPKTISYEDFLKHKTTGKSASSSASQPDATLTASASNATPVPVKKATAEQPIKYKVAPSDTLYSISRKFNVSIKELKALNKLQSASIKPGQKLVISK